MGDGDPEAARSYADSLDDPLCRVGLAARQPRFVLFSPNLPEIVNVGDVATPATASASVAVPPTQCASAGSGQMTLRLPYVAFSASRYRGTQPFWYHAWVVAATPPTVVVLSASSLSLYVTPSSLMYWNRPIGPAIKHSSLDRV